MEEKQYIIITGSTFGVNLPRSLGVDDEDWEGLDIVDVKAKEE
jgi:hypothetical protein